MAPSRVLAFSTGWVVVVGCLPPLPPPVCGGWVGCVGVVGVVGCVGEGCCCWGGVSGVEGTWTVGTGISEQDTSTPPAGTLHEGAVMVTVWPVGRR